MNKDTLLLLKQIAQIIFDKKGFNIVAIDVKGMSMFTDYFVLAEGNVDRHVMAIAKSIVEVLDGENIKPIHVEGLEEGDWVVLDYLDVVIHLFKPGMRDRYRLEELWCSGKVIDLNFDLSQMMYKV